MAESPEMIEPEVAAPLRLHSLAYSLGVTAAITAAARLELADALGEQPLTVGALASAVGADEEALGQLLRALACQGLFRETTEGVYAHTELSRLLRADAPGGRRPMALLAGAPFAWQIWSRLDEAVRTGRSVFPEVYGTTLFTHLHEEEPELGALFDRAMAKSGEITAAAVAEALDLADCGTVADIGGGRGTLLRALLERWPQLRGVLFDLERVVSTTDPALLDGGELGDRCAVLAGDCHQDIPVKADTYLLKGVLHMWDDDTAVAVLRTLASSAPAGARVVLIEQVLDLSRTPEIATVMNLLMLVSQGGRERTSGQFRALFEQAGLEFRQITGTGSQVHLVEGVVPAAR
ncbi:acetylserotonin O-methyltransferase [Kitasatospora sp. NBC_01250]|uniref:methyltransferase n=1 Tax=Kitasatospora sp. NBC_01250 TaxID=2903571 RepID=UPI002E3381EC|nr:methyltransferase [Kitasatospora sp. NBC_01250]